MTLLHKMLTLLLAIMQFFAAAFSAPTIKNVQYRKAIGNMQLMNSGESNLGQTIEYAHNIKNTVQASYTDKVRSNYEMSNSSAILTHKLTALNKTASLTDIEGRSYITDSFESFYCDRAGTKYYFENSVSDARINTIRLGEYYYECHVRDLSKNGFKVDKTYHFYGDRLYMQYSLLSSKATKMVGGFGSEIKIPVKTVKAFQIKDADGIHSDLSFDAKSVEYAAFDIDGVGVIGFVIPADGSTGSFNITADKSYYTLTQIAAFIPGTGLNDNNEQGGYDLNCITFGCRIYTDNTHDFVGIEKAAYEEYVPLELTVGENNAHAAYEGYDALRGAYTISLDGTDFQTAYDNPDLRFTVPITLNGADDDRSVFIRANGRSGCLEASVLLDDTDTLMPIDVEVCKNFRGDGGEPFYSPIDYAYGDSIFPICISKNSSVEFKLIDLYQNWGNFPLKQLSSIEFFVSYYHLSTGTTESNCIAPYFVYGKDGWTLPDFRNRSGQIWSGQPQFNSVGILKFMTQYDKKGNEVLSEFTGSSIASSGLSYSDVTDYYTDDAGKYTYSLRHVEMPQTDENRTYYTLKVDFVDDVTYNNFRRDFNIFYFDGRMVDFKKATWLNENNVCVSKNTAKGSKPDYHVLGNDHPYFGFYCLTDETTYQLNQNFGCNFALLIRDSKIISNGDLLNVPFVFKEDPTRDNTSGSLTLDADKLSFKKGDSIEINMILLPWGKGTENTAANVINVRNDSIIAPIQIEALKGSVVYDNFLPIVNCINNEAEFVVSGGKNNISVTVNGFDSLKAPTISIKQNGMWQPYAYSSNCGYDGYSIRTEDDGTYSISFVFESNGNDDYIFKINQ